MFSRLIDIVPYGLKEKKKKNPLKLFLFSKHILCKESMVIVKKFDFEILTYLYVLRFPELIYDFLRDVSSLCMYVREQDSV